MITNENKKLAQWAMEFALKNGCQASRVSIYNGSSSSFEIRDMKMDRLQTGVSAPSPQTVWIKRNWKVSFATVSLPLVSWRKTRHARCPTLLSIIKEEVLTCN